MSLQSIVKNAVKTIDKIVKPLEAIVSFEKCTSTDVKGKRHYDNGVIPLRASVDWKQRQLRTLDGTLSVSRASVMFLDFKALMTATENEGVDDKDRITLPDGTTGPILDMSGYIDPGNTAGNPFATEVFLG